MASRRVCAPRVLYFILRARDALFGMALTLFIQHYFPPPFLVPMRKRSTSAALLIGAT